MTQPAESLHLKISDDLSIQRDLLEHHLEKQHSGSITEMQFLRNEIKKKKRTVQFKYLSAYLKENTNFNSLSEKDKQKCSRNLSRNLAKKIDGWLSEKQTPQVSNDVSGLEACFQIEESRDEVANIIRLSDKFSNIESPSGWKVSR